MSMCLEWMIYTTGQTFESTPIFPVFTEITALQVQWKTLNGAKVSSKLPEVKEERLGHQKLKSNVEFI